jgi:hypothetical protein
MVVYLVIDINKRLSKSTIYSTIDYGKIRKP